MNKQVLILSLFFFLIGNAFSFADENENVMKIHDVEALAGDIILIEVEITNDDTFVAFQLDIPLPESFAVVPDSEQLFRDDGHEFSFNVLAGNVVRIFAYDFLLTPFLGNEGIIVSFEVSTDPEDDGIFALDILNGEIIDPTGVNIITETIPGTITLDSLTAFELPFEEDFTGYANGEMPDFWLRTHNNWGVWNSNNAGGESAPELRFNWQPSGEGTFRAITPLLDGSDVDDIMLTFMHSVDDWSGGYTLKIQTSLDGETWTDQWELEIEADKNAPADRKASTRGDIPPTEMMLVLDGVGGEMFHVAFVYEGNTFNINQWYVDDVFVGELVYIAELPFEEDFTGYANGEMPDFWLRTHANWGVWNSNNAGGQSAPELRFNWSPSGEGTFRAITPLINGIGEAEITLSFMHSVNDFSGGYSLLIQTSLDGETWTDQWELEIEADKNAPADRNAATKGDIPPTHVTFDLDGVAGEVFHLAFVYEGNSFNINQWYVDDVFVGDYVAPETYQVTFVVEDPDGAEIDNAIVTLGTITNDPGDYIFEDILAGEYAYTVIAEGFEPASGMVEVIDEDVTVMVELQPIEDPDGDLIFEQPVFDGGTAVTSVIDDAAEIDYEAADNFFAVDQVIGEVIIYGLTLKFTDGSWQEMVPDPTEPFFVRFYDYVEEFVPGLEAPVSGTYEVALMDSWGDGWNGGLLTVYVNGVAVLTEITMPTGAGPDYHTFTAEAGDEITTLYVAGNWPWENYYAILDPDGNILAEEGGTWDSPGATTPGSIESGMMTVEPDWANPISTQAIDADVTTIGPVWNGAYTLYRFSLPLEESMNLTEAWVSAQIDANNGSGTWFLWINSDEGDEIAWQRLEAVRSEFVRGETHPSSLTYKGEASGYRGQLDYDLAFELWTGTVVEPTDFARVQIIHNSADDLVEEVDIFVNGDLFLENVGFRQATPFMDVPAGVDLDIVVAPAGAGIENGVGPITVQFDVDETYVVVAAGNVSAEGYDPVEPFALYVFDQGQEEAANPDNTDLLAFHGSTDAPTVSVWEVTVVNDEIIGDFSFGDFDGYLPLITGDYIIEIRDAAGENVVAAYEAPLASLNLQGEAIVVVASGFLNPVDNNDGPAFGLFVALSTGGDLIELPLYEEEPPPVIYNLPFEEDFTDGPIGNVPEDWMRTHSNWAVFNSNNAGGESAPELRFNWTPSGNTTFRAITPLLNGADLDNIMLTFMHSTDDYTGDYTLRIQTSLDGETWTDQWELYVEENLAATDDRTAESKGDIPPTHVTVMLDDVAGEVFHLAFVFEGNSFNINQWYIDDVFVGEAVYMATLPFEEDFSDAPVGDMPEHWERTHTHWSVFNTNNAGGEAAPELRFNWSPSAIDVFRAITPLLNAADVDDVMLMFMHSVNDFSGDYTLKVQTSLDGETWTDQWTMDMKQAIRTSDDREAEGGRDVPPTEQVVLLDGVGGEQFYLAFVYDGNSWNINQWYIDDIFVGEAMDMFEVTFHVKEDSADEAPIAGASININGDIITTNANGVASISLWAGDYTANITATGYIAESVSFTVANADLDIEVHMLDNIVEPFNLDVTTEGLEPGQALFTWNDYGDEYEFRYDDGVVDAQLGFQGTWNSVMGAVHFNNAVLHEMTWQLTEEGGPHNTVKVWVLGLTPEGLPDRNNVLYTAENVPNTDNQWNTYEFTSPVNAPEGFFIGLSYNGFLGLAVDDGVGAPWDFVPGTQFGVFNITDPTSAFTDISFWGFEVNYLIRAYGANLGEVYTAGSKAFVGFDVFLDGAMVAEGVQDTEFMFEGLTTGEYTAGVRSVYTTGMSDIIGIDFDIEVEQPDLFEVVFHVDISKAMQYDLLGGFDPDVHHILMTGSLLGWAEPGSDPDNQVLEWLTADPMVYGITHHLEAGTYEYKYFSDYIGDGWDGGEWPGDPNRVVVVSGDMLVEDVFGPPDLDVIETDDISVNLYPVPARSRLFVESNVPIAEIRMIDMLGQVVYTTTVNEHRTEIDVSNMRNGIYFIQMTTNRGIITHRVQVTK